VDKNWHTFDVVVLVMDARQGVNTDEQLDLLELAKNNLATSKSLPLIVLCNKVDDPDDEEQVALLAEARNAIEKLFHVSDRTTALKTLLDDSKNMVEDGTIDPSLFPVVLPVSARHAFIYRCGARLSFQDFCKMEFDFIEKIGKDSYGRQWKRFGKDQQLAKAYEAVSDEEQCQDGLEASNFETFIKVLSLCIGDEDRQGALIQKQIDVALKRLKDAKPDTNLGTELLSVHKTLTLLGKSTDHLPATFWASYKGLKTKAFAEFDEKFEASCFANTIDQLFGYIDTLRSVKWSGEMEKVVNETRELVLQYAIGVIQAEKFKAKSHDDRSLILGSMLLASSNELFNDHFGFLKLHLESCYTFALTRAARAALDPNRSCVNCKCQVTECPSMGTGVHRCGQCSKMYIGFSVSSCPRRCLSYSHGGLSLSRKKDSNGVETGHCANCGNTFTYWDHNVAFELKVADGQLVPANAEQYRQCVTVVVPERLKDKSHFGYVLWKACQLKKIEIDVNELD
jgi:GTPase SAR1 family protein